MILEEAIKQSNFSNDVERAAINLYYSHAQMHHFSSGLLRPYDISVQQFNILRILRGQKKKSISIGEITDRMIDKMSNTSRLIEKLRLKGLIERQECERDRRKAEIRITAHGLEIIAEASEVMDEQMMSKWEALNSEEITVLNKLLDKLNQ